MTDRRAFAQQKDVSAMARQDSLLNFSYAKVRRGSLASRAQSDTPHVPINVDKK